MSVYDRWHTKKPRLDENGDPVKPCREHKQYPSTEHGRGDRWQVRWRDDNGKQCKANFPKKAGNDPETCADAFDVKVQAELNAGTYVDPEAGKITLSDYARQWRSGLTSDPNTLRTIDERLSHICGVEPGISERKSRRKGDGSSTIGGKPMAFLSKRPSAVQQWVKAMERNDLAPQYIRQIVGTLSTVFMAALDDGIVSRNPVQAHSVTLPKISRKKLVPWTLEQVSTAADSLGGRNSLMAYLGAGAALRQGEIFGIALEDIDFIDRRVVHVRRQVRLIDKQLVFALPKGDKERNVPLSNALALLISQQIADYPPVRITLPWKIPDGVPHTANLLFVRPDGRPHHRQSFSYTWQAARRAAGAPSTRANGMHVLRHTAASAWLAAGVDIRTVAEYLGHNDPGFTLKTYAHLMPGAADRARRAMDAFFQDTAEASALEVPSDAR